MEVYERRTSTGSGPFSSLDDGFAQIFNQIVSIRVKKLSNTNFISSRHIKREKSSLPVDVRRSKTSLLNNYSTRLVCCKCRTGPDPNFRVLQSVSGVFGLLGCSGCVPGCSVPFPVYCSGFYKHLFEVCKVVVWLT